MKKLTIEKKIQSEIKQKEYQEQYRIDHKNKQKEYSKKWYNNNKHDKLKYNKEYNLNHKEEIKLYKKQYDLNNKEKQLVDDVVTLQAEEKILITELTDKYGPGSIDMKTGMFVTHKKEK